jgi:aspartyl-tRNA(Asn)/glutamyl-tRNA(Gln) amidotransferase subunit A
MDLTWMPAWQIREMVADKEISPVEVTEHFLGRAEALDPILHCYDTLDAPGARRQAKRAEQAVLRDEDLGPLHGVPVSVKAHIAVNGLPLFPFEMQPNPADPPIADRDAPVVARLRDAGAVIFGTNVMPGMGPLGLKDDNGESTTDMAFHARNPWDLNRVPGSSSAGGCAAVAAGIIPAALGTDGGGSTRLPAAWSGLLGLHSTIGRVPMAQAPGSSWNTSIGPITRDARSGAIVLQAISGPDPAEIISLDSPPPDYLADIDAGIEGLRFAWTDDYGCTGEYAGPESARVIDTVRTAAQSLRALGGIVETTTETFPDWMPMVGLGPQGTVGSRTALLAGLDCRAEWRRGLERTFADHDLLLSPTIQHIAFTTQRWAEAWTQDLLTFSLQWCAHTFPQNFLGWPALSVPCGFVDGMPVGLQLTGRPDTEGLLYRVANTLLEATPLDIPSAVRP